MRRRVPSSAWRAVRRPPRRMCCVREGRAAAEPPEAQAAVQPEVPAEVPAAVPAAERAVRLRYYPDHKTRIHF